MRQQVIEIVLFGS